ncbi:type IV toxin-antitoxin system AbiEi family antitoxin domain-containing protein [Arsenicicoccus piscis]|uniref:Transcriptional regulator, AbiEi antitoxin, Type IV TA system n=1 Tax=Arsenicicoccus piscis TaxID=673954 RepID=A0ABQ6HJP7_9MICO|nr:type IV toxin-antitoxin system AbiEi family antitoxin domain-containing protein [Arsenicicoccus piscis]MCH8627296.1 type IV toxin-antitoxin system AbiEi family antitoxin domain-containing protein [Arsenicicoccus piscis]GMA18714.1 hypothetical protein GCM10025862_07350 [Arsenicicoccus piscis]
MGSRQDLPPHLRARALERSGVLSRTELLQAGLAPTVVARMAGEWATVIPGIYCLDARPETAPARLSHAVRVEAGLLHAGPRAVASGLTAAHLDGLVDREPHGVTLHVPGRRLAPVTGWSFVRVTPGHRLGPRPLTPRRTAMEDTVLDVVALRDQAAAPAAALGASVRRARVDAPVRRCLPRAQDPHRARRPGVPLRGGGLS